MENLSQWSSCAWTLWNVALSDASCHGKVGDGGDSIDEKSRDVEGSVPVCDPLRECSKDDEAGGHDAEDDPEVRSTGIGDLLWAGGVMEA